MADNEQKKGTEKKTGHENLIPLNERTPEEVKAITSAGGKASVQKKRLAKDMRESMKVLLSMTLTKDQQRDILGDTVDMLDGYEVTMADALNLKMLQEAGAGNTKAFEVSRDTAGYKPIEQIQTDVNIMSESDRALIEKLAKREGVKAETD